MPYTFRPSAKSNGLLCPLLTSAYRRDASRYPSLNLMIHIHDTRNMGMVNTLAAIECGVKRTQSTLGGLGGCPFAPGASGNLATEDLVFMLAEMGYGTGIDFAALKRAALEQRELIPTGVYSGHHINIGTAQPAG